MIDSRIQELESSVANLEGWCRGLVEDLERANNRISSLERELEIITEELDLDL